MSRYSRNFEDANEGQVHVRGGLGYSRYRKPQRVAIKTSCKMCDGDGTYTGASGPVVCDLCEGKGRVDADTLEEVALFRSRNQAGARNPD